MKKETDRPILIADYGRSGQGWLSFMLCYILNATYIEPYDFLKGVKYSTNDEILKYTRGRLKGRDKTQYSLVIKTHNYPAPNFNLTDKVIYLTRDPRDVAISWYFMDIANMQGTKNEGPQLIISRGLKDFLRNHILRIRIFSFLRTAIRWRKHVLEWQTIPCFHVKYEDISNNTEKVLSDLLDYLSEPVDTKIVREAIEKFSFERVAKRKKGQENPLNPEFRKGIVGDYKNHMTKLHKLIFRIILRKVASGFGYEL